MAGPDLRISTWLLLIDLNLRCLYGKVRLFVVALVFHERSRTHRRYLDVLIYGEVRVSKNLIDSGYPCADTQHQFNTRESDWGFTSFMPLHELYDPSKGFLLNDTLVIEADVNAPKVVDYWHDSKKETGFVGLKNQGATCYMNSLLQTLYHIPYFRKVLTPSSFSCV